MPQIFHRSFNTLSKVSIFGALIILAFLAWALLVLARSSYVTNVDVARMHPVPISIERDVRDRGIDCCCSQTFVEVASFAGVPPSKRCMSCLSHIWACRPLLEPVRESYRTGKSIEWVRFHRLAD